MKRNRFGFILSIVTAALFAGWRIAPCAAECSVVITHPSGDVSVSYGVDMITLQGTADGSVSNRVWTNAATAQSGPVSDGTEWSVASIPIQVGPNLLTVSGAGTVAISTTNAWDNGSESAYSGGWHSASNGGEGFGLWTLWTSATDPNNGGFFMAEGQANLDIGPRAWGMYANDSHLSLAMRPLAAALEVGQTLSASIDHNEIDEGGAVYMSLHNSEVEWLWYLVAHGGEETYRVNGVPTDLAVSQGGLDVAFTLTTPTTYSATVTPTVGDTLVITGSLMTVEHPEVIANVGFWNDNAGPDGPRNFYVNNLRITTPGTSGGICSDSVIVTRAAPPSTNTSVLVINEFLASNGSTNADEDGDFSDWIELHNSGDEALNIQGYGLTDDPSALFQWVFPNVTLMPGEYRLVWASGKDRRPNDGEGGELHANFAISVEGEPLRLTAPSGDPVDAIPPVTLRRDISYGRSLADPDVWVYFDQPTPGAPNTTTGYTELLNDVAFSMQAGMYTSPVPVLLEADSPAAAIHYTLDGSIPTIHSPLFTTVIINEPFDGGSNAPPGWTFTDIRQYQTPSSSGLNPPSLRFDTNTASVVSPSFVNATNVRFMMKGQSIGAASTFSVDGRIDDTWMVLAEYDHISNNKVTRNIPLSTNVTRLRFRYTKVTGNLAFDDLFLTGAPGSEGALWLDSRAGEPNGISEIPTNYEWGDEAWVPPFGEVYKIHTIRARAFKEGALPGPVVTRSYLIDPAGADRYSLPVFSVVTDPANFFDPQIGIYVPGWNNNFTQRGRDWERPAHIEFFEADGAPAFAQDVGVRIHGGTSRNRPRKTLRIYARADYGESWINYPLFPDKPVGRYKRFLLRQSGNDWDQSLFRDAMMQSLVKKTDVDVQYSRPAILFVNGEYWGIHNIRDRFDQHHLDTHYDTGDEQNITMLENNSVLDRGHSAGLTHYNNLRSFLDSPGVALSSDFAYVETQMDVDNFIDLQVARIYYRDTDWPGNNQPLWRYHTPDYQPHAPRGKDGRWRWMMLDTDFGFGLNFDYVYDSASGYGPNDASHDTLAFALEPNGPDWPNPSWSTFILRRLMENETFRQRFVNRFADFLNSSFSSNRVADVIHSLQSEYAPEIDEHVRRWGAPWSEGNWSNHVATMRAFAEQRPAYLRAHLINAFPEVTGTRNVTVDVSDPNAGWVRINNLDVRPSTAGVGEEPYPWTGSYFQGVPIPVTAIARPGYRFVGWVETSELGMRTFSEDDDLVFIAEFEELPPRQPIHYWNFNETNNLLDASFTVGDGLLDIVPGVATVITHDDGQDFVGENARFGDPAGSHLRINNPLGSEMTWEVPTSGYEEILVMYETRRSGQGAGLQVVEYATNALDFVGFTNIVTFNDAPVLHTLDFTGVPGVDDNTHFTIRITFEQGAGGTEGNNRFDNITVDGRPLGDPNRPPEVEEEIALQELIAQGAVAQINLDDVFTDPDGDPMTFGASSGNTAVATVGVSGNQLTITPGSRGGATVTVTADDGFFPPVAHAFRVLVYPEAHELSSGNYVFDEWDPNLAEGVYPPHMLFLQSDQDDPVIDTDLLYAYFLEPDDYHPDDEITIGFPYNNTRRTRLTGLGADGISFINTGQSRDLGGALLALDTRDVTNAPISWLAGTVVTNVRVYAVRLQYRVGTDGPFLDVLDEANQPVEYVRNATAGHAQLMPAVTLPAVALDEEYVQILWRYYHVSGEVGSRPELRLDDILVSGSSIQPAESLAFIDEPPPYWQSGVALPFFSVRAVDEDGFTDVQYTNEIALSLISGSGVLDGQTNVTAASGVAVFTNVTLTGSGAYILQGSSGALTPVVSDAIQIDDEPVFIPGDEADWTTDANWTSLNYPNAVSAFARINPPSTEERSVNIRSPVTIGHLIVNNTNTMVRNRIRDRDIGNALTFSTTSGPATVDVQGSGEGWVEIENDAGTILQTNLVISVEHMQGDPEFGALRIRSLWSGPGGLIKTGYGVMSMTGGDKHYTGPTVIEQGVVRVTESSAPPNTAGVTVLPGGQLRLVSGIDPRVYTFGGMIVLNSLGRGGPVPEGEEQGILGALRYDPGFNDNKIEVTNDILLAGPSSLHVDGTRNVMELSGALSGTGTVSKSGGGIVVLGGDSSAYVSPVTLTTGEVRVNGVIGSTVAVTTDTVLRGSGHVGALSGQGTVAPGPGSTILTARSVNGLHYAFRFSQTGAPDYALPSDSGNALLRLTNATPIVGGFNAGNTVSLFFDVPSLNDGTTYLGAFFTDAEDDFSSALQSATWSIYVADVGGGVAYDDQSYVLYDHALDVAIDTIEESADFGEGPVNGRIVRIRFGDHGVTDGIPNAWWNRFPAIAESNRIANADFDEDGFTNEEEYIADTDPTDPDSRPDPGIAGAAGITVLTLTTGVTTNSRVYDVWWSADLLDEPQSWHRTGLNVPGDAGGLPLNLTVTNTPSFGVYRTGVSLP